MKLCTVYGVVTDRAGSRCPEHGRSANPNVALIGAAGGAHGEVAGRVIRTCDNGHPPARILSGTPCPDCERRRPSRGQRGYGPAHDRARRALAGMLPAPCFYCRTVIGQGEPFVAAHVVDGDASAGWAAAHAACNERAKVRRGWGSTSMPAISI